MSPNAPRLLGDSFSPGVVICCCKLSSANTWASLVMQPRCKHLKSLIVSKQAFNSQGVAGELRVTSLEKLPSPRGRGQAEVALAGTTQLHKKPGSWVFYPPYSSDYLLLFFSFWSSLSSSPLFFLLFPNLLCYAHDCTWPLRGTLSIVCL